MEPVWKKFEGEIGARPDRGRPARPTSNDPAHASPATPADPFVRNDALEISNTRGGPDRLPAGGDDAAHLHAGGAPLRLQLQLRLGARADRRPVRLADLHRHVLRRAGRRPHRRRRAGQALLAPRTARARRHARRGAVPGLRADRRCTAARQYVHKMHDVGIEMQDMPIQQWIPR